MNLSDFNYSLPHQLIAQYPVKKRDKSRLMVLNKANGCIEHRIFSDLTDYLEPGDVLVINDTKVIPARLIGFKANTKGKVEVFLLRNKGDNVWEVLLKGKVVKHQKIIFSKGELIGEVIERGNYGKGMVHFDFSGDFNQVLRDIGGIPLPPYIERDYNLEPEVLAVDKERYQTIYARQEGAVAAPTAGLHFTENLLRGLKRNGVEVVNVTLHVGLGTFQPVREEDLKKHKMEAECFEIKHSSAEKINKAKQEGKRVIAVGTTTTRVLETVAGKKGCLQEKKGRSDLFIVPGFKFKIVDVLLTNFHLPKSTLLMLVSAFTGRDLIMKAYKEAIEKEYRFYSYGDAMLIL